MGDAFDLIFLRTFERLVVDPLDMLGIVAVDDHSFAERFFFRPEQNFYVLDAVFGQARRMCNGTQGKVHLQSRDASDRFELFT